MPQSNPFGTRAIQSEPSYDPDVVFANFRNRPRPAADSESEARARQRGRTSEDRMRGVVVEVKRSRRGPSAFAPRPDITDEPTAESVFRF